MTVSRKIEKRKNGSLRISWSSILPSKTDQSFTAESDVNNIIQKYRKTGMVTHLAKQQGFYADHSQIPDLLTALTTVNDATSRFKDLPSEIRKRFGNDPVELVKFLGNPKNEAEAIELGLAVPRVKDPSLADHVFEGLEKHEAEKAKRSKKND